MSPMEPDESTSIVQLDESHPFMTSDYEEQQYRKWKMRSIYRVPARLTALNREAYQPQIVSLGPYHHGKDHLLPMEEHKRRVVRHFLKRSKKPIEHFFESLREVAWDLKQSYDTLDLKWKAGSSEGVAHQFLELMITDGYFMLEILRFTANMVGDYTPSDPIFSYRGKVHVMPYISQDMLMLENQLPRLVLDRLVFVESDGNQITILDFAQDDEFVNSLIHNFYHGCTAIKRMGKCLHVLDVYRKSILTEPEKKDKVESKYSGESTPSVSAIGLSEHGIQFKHCETGSLEDISFVSSVLRLPRIIVDDGTESIFLNLLAFERSHVGAGNEVASYIYFMDILIDKEGDVALLRAQNIIQNELESDEAAAKVFNSLAKCNMIDPESSLNEVLNNVDTYCNKRWNMWRANLIHTYFRNPWVTLSLIAAVFLFALTIIQTVYSMLGYCN